MRKYLWLVMPAVLFLACPVSASTMGSIGKERVNVRSEPNLNSEVLFQASRGYPVEIEKQQKNWVYFTDWKHQAGWVNKGMISKTKTGVVMGEVNIRKGPGLNHPVVTKASQGEIYKIFGEKNDWVQVGYYLENEKIGWIRDDLIWGE
jgi:uncharacterized protein YgiM (DUF1202 family)